jgi:hypothetical protein
MTAGVLFPGFGLTILALHDSSPIGWLGPAVMALLGSALLTYGVMRADPGPKARGVALRIYALMFGAYGYGAGMVVNTALDTGTPTIYSVHVLSKHVSSGRGRSLYLTVEPWGADKITGDISVNGELYRAAIGSVVCVNLHSGALGAPWYALSLCQPSTTL